MANELVHGTVGVSMTQAEFEAIGLHVLNSQATGDVIYASSATQLSRLGIGATNAILTVIGGVPTWQTSLSGLTFVAPALGAATATSVNGLVITTTAGTLTIANNASAALVTSGNYSITLTATAATSITLPTTGTLATLAGAETITAKLGYNGLVVTPNTGAITTGSWTATVISPVYGGTGIANNVASTITITGAYTLGLTLSAATALTLPTTGTLATLAGTEELDSKTLDSSVAKGTWTSSAWGIPAGTLQGTITLNAQTLDAGAVDAEFLSSGVGTGIQITNTNAGDTGARLTLYTNSPNPAQYDDVGEVRFSGEDDASAKIIYGLFRCRIDVVAAATVRANYLWYLKNAGADNLAMQLTGPGVLSVDLGGTGSAAQVDLFDDYDDALVLKQTIQQRNREVGVKLGLFYEKDTGSGYMMNVQPMIKLLAGAAYQTRQQVDELKTNILARLDAVEQKQNMLLQGG